MKKVIVHLEYDFLDDVEDDECFYCAKEILFQSELGDDDMTLVKNDEPFVE